MNRCGRQASKNQGVMAIAAINFGFIFKIYIYVYIYIDKLD